MDSSTPVPHAPMADFVGLFMQADPVVKSIMAGLLLVSLLSWGIILEKSLSLWWAARADRRFLKLHRSGATPERGANDAARLHGAMTEEAGGANWGITLRECVEGRLRLMLVQIQRKREAGLAFLATVASSGPFVGLFGTVWGVMSSFTAIAETKSTNLAVVAPGIAEALLATALGLFAAIPAAVFFNRLSAKVSSSLGILDELGQEIIIGLARSGIRRETRP